MSVVRQQRHERLRLGGVAGTVELSTRMPTGDPVIIRRKPGVVVFEDIPIGATVHARVDRPLSLVEEPATREPPSGQAARTCCTRMAAAGWCTILPPRPLRRGCPSSRAASFSTSTSAPGPSRNSTTGPGTSLSRPSYRPVGP